MPSLAIANDVRANEVPDVGLRRRPPVIVLNLFHSGLAIARQLSASGMRTVGLSADSSIYGNFTRCCEVRQAPSSQEEPEQLANFLAKAAPQLRGAVIFPTRDADVLFLDRFRPALEPLYLLAIPSRKVLHQILNKDALADVARAAGVAVPRTEMASSHDELQVKAKIVGYPCVVKPVRSVDWRTRQNWKQVGGTKAYMATNSAELERVYECVSRAHREVLLQE